MKIAVIAAAFALTGGGTALAQPVEIPPSATSVSAKPNDGDKIICRTEQKTGQRFDSKVCHTKAQWAAMGEYGRSLVESSQQGAPAHSCSGGAC